jgi:hypothetical protein
MPASTILLSVLPLLAGAEPHIELVTMGQAPELFHRYGHAALCIVAPDQPELSLCFNYGTTNFESPPHEIGWKFLRGTSRFWVSTQTYADMLDLYRYQDRTIWVQRLPFSPEQVSRMIGLLKNDLKEENRSYRYHHFDDNCTTRLRDHIDRVTDGTLQEGSQRGAGTSFREMGRRGIAEHTGLLATSLFLLGRRLDREITLWEAMFHPDQLRVSVHQTLGATPVTVYQRTGPPMPQEGGLGQGWILLLAALVSLPILVTRLLGRFERLGYGVTAALLTGIAGILWFAAIVTHLTEIRMNEALVLLWPTDFLLAVLGSRRRVWYARIRMAGLAAAAFLMAVGVLIQPLWAILAVAGLPCLLSSFRRRPQS